jgi:hypothetical protein
MVTSTVSKKIDYGGKTDDHLEEHEVLISTPISTLILLVVAHRPIQILETFVDHILSVNQSHKHWPDLFREEEI